MADYARLRALFMCAYNNAWIQIVLVDGYVFERLSTHPC